MHSSPSACLPASSAATTPDRSPRLPSSHRPSLKSLGPTSDYVAVHRGRCPSDADLAVFGARGRLVLARHLSEQSRRDHSTQRLVFGHPTGRPWCLRPQYSQSRQSQPTTTSTLTVTGPTETVPDNACVEYSISGGMAPYQLTSAGGRWMISAPCRGDTPTRYTLLTSGGRDLVRDGVGQWRLRALVTVTDADGERETFTLKVV